MRVAVVYYTRFGHTRIFAEQLAQELGAELRQIRGQRDHGYPAMGFGAILNMHFRMVFPHIERELAGKGVHVAYTTHTVTKDVPEERLRMAGRELARQIRSEFLEQGEPPRLEQLSRDQPQTRMEEAPPLH